MGGRGEHGAQLSPMALAFGVLLPGPPRAKLWRLVQQPLPCRSLNAWQCSESLPETGAHGGPMTIRTCDVGERASRSIGARSDCAAAGVPLQRGECCPRRRLGLGPEPAEVLQRPGAPGRACRGPRGPREERRERRIARVGAGGDRPPAAPPRGAARPRLVDRCELRGSRACRRAVRARSGWRYRLTVDGWPQRGAAGPCGPRRRLPRCRCANCKGPAAARLPGEAPTASA